MGRFSYGDVRSTISEAYCFSVNAFMRLIEMRDDIINDMAASQFEPEMAVALKEIHLVLSGYENRDLMVDTYKFNNFQAHITKEILDRPDGADNSAAARGQFLAGLFENNAHLWIMGLRDWMLWQEILLASMVGRESEYLFSLADEALDRDPHASMPAGAKAAASRARDRWLEMSTASRQQDPEETVDAFTEEVTLDPNSELVPCATCSREVQLRSGNLKEGHSVICAVCFARQLNRADAWK